MNKRSAIFLFYFLLSIPAFSQRRIERLLTDWPAEYNWKIVKRETAKGRQVIMIIPGKDSINAPTLIGSITAYEGLHYSRLDDMIKNYVSRLDSCSTLTVIEELQHTSYPWALFKIETPVTNKYAEPESDLYYVVQGKFGLYEDYVAIKEPLLDDEFIKRWTQIFKASELRID